jgi:hypothetical protein
MVNSIKRDRSPKHKGDNTLETLGTLSDGIIVPINSIDFDFCAECGVKITPDNDSGWERFINGHTTQKVCIDCDNKPIAINKKNE